MRSEAMLGRSGGQEDEEDSFERNFGQCQLLDADTDRSTGSSRQSLLF